MDPLDVIYISDTESSVSSIVLVKVPPDEIKKAPASDTYRPSSASQNNEEVEVVTLSSVSQKSTERCPVTWTESAKKSNLRLLSSESFYSPSPRAKVTNWLNSSRYRGDPSDQQEVSAEIQSNVKDSPLNSLTSFSTNKSSILVRQDYKKSNLTESNFGAKNSVVNNVNTPNNRINYLENKSDRTAEVLSQFMLLKNSNMCNRTLLDNTHLVQKPSKPNEQQPSEDDQLEVDVEGITNSTPLSVKSLVESMPGLCHTVVGNDAAPKIKACPSMPSSPEMQKKNELCQYLKLMNMNPSDSRTTRMTQNRRSTRVKHLALMLQKRELERKLNSKMQEEKKKSAKVSDADSRNSSENDGGSKMSKKSNISIVSSNASKTPSRTGSPTQKMPAEENKPRNSTKPSERRNSVRTPSKSLQVPEVSTTSISKNKNITELKSTSTSKNKNLIELKSTTVSKLKNFTELKNPIKIANANGAQRMPEHGFTNSKVAFRKSDSDVVVQHKENGSSNSCKSEIITRKSFEQLCMNVKSLKSLRTMSSHSTDSLQESTSPSFLKSTAAFDKGLGFSLVKSAANIPNTHSDFDDAMESILNPKFAEKESPSGSITETPKLTRIKHGNVDEKSKLLLKRKAKISDTPPKPKVPKLDPQLRPPKRKEVKKFNNSNRPNTRFRRNAQRRNKYPNPRHMNRLRSRKRLKQVELKKILLQETKKRVAKTKQKQTLEQSSIQPKDFKTAELIQHGSENNSNTAKKIVKQTENADKSIKVESTPTKTPLNKIKKRLPEAEMWKKYFTSEHRKAYIESIKYLEEEENARKPLPDSPKKESSPESRHNAGGHEEKTQNVDQDDQNSPPFRGFKPTDIKDDEVQKLKETCENIKNSITPIPSCSIATSSNHSFIDKHRPSSEDLEVDQLMSCKRMKDQATQKDCESPSGGRDTLQTDVTDPTLADHSRCTSSSDPSSANSWSLQTVESNPDPRTSTSRQEPIEVPCRSPTSSPKLRISTTPLYQPEDTSTRLSIGQPEVVNISQIQPPTCTYVPLPSNGTEVKSLHHCLTQPKIRNMTRSRNSSPINRQHWQETLGIDRSPRTKTSQSHTIYLSTTNGAVMNAYYLDYNLVIVQELIVSFWNQSPLGNILGAQDMWIPKGNTRRMVLGNGCAHKVSSETLISSDNTVAYIELWTKEHKSDKRERPVADIFVVIYLRLSRSGPDKKVLQLENIHSYASDVQYIVLRNAGSIIVSWNVIADGVSSTLVHHYHLSPDYQTVTNITKMQTVGHYVSSLHNIEDCDTLILGCGDYKLTLWDVEDGYVVATIDLMEIQPQPRTVWAKRDRGFLFTLQHFPDGALQLIAINSFDSTWKKLQTYTSEIDYENLLGVCMENGLLVAFYDTGVLCWSAQTGIPVLEDTSEESGVLLPYGKHVVVVLNNQVHVRHALEYLITVCPMEES